MQVRFEVKLRPNRREGGLLSVYDAMTGLLALAPPIPCLGRAASAAGNPSSTQVNGDTPTGEYRVNGLMGPDVAPDDLARYGIHPRIRLTGVLGNAAIRETVSPDNLRIHGGHMKGGKLMVTHGCIRIADVDMQTLLAFLSANAVPFPFSMTVTESDDPPAIVSDPDDSLAGAPT